MTTVRFWHLCSFALLLFLVRASPARSEPWLSTRNAQNCAGCHAPGRKNVQPIDRRCSLSCQGCHVNPNGGGLRSAYGKWNEERWLRSFRSDLLRNPKSTLPVSKQVYGKEPFTPGNEEMDDVARHGAPLAESEHTTMDEGLYTRADGLEKTAVKSPAEFWYQVPDQDPSRVMELTKTDAGADIRWETDSSKRSGDAKSEYHSFLMDADFGLEWRPFYKHVHGVYEARIEGTPLPGTKYERQLATGRTRSLYMLVGDLPYNTFVMGGLYRPLFGNFVPDHYTLAQEMASFGMSGDTKNYNLLFEAVSVGTAPNVPYLNVHMITKNLSSGDPADNTRGWAANLGMRFVTLGASINYSYWRTNDVRVDRKTSLEMHSLGAAARIWRTTASLELLSVQRDLDVQDYRQGGTDTLDTQTQLWRENYLTLMYAQSNTLTTILPGKSTQVKGGLRSFWLPGVETWLMVENREDDTKNPQTSVVTVGKTNGVEAQLHLYF